MKRKRRSFNYAWKIFAACCLLYGSITGMIVNCRGIYFLPASAELGVTPGTYSSYLFYYGVSACLAFPFAVGALKRFPIKPVLSIYILVFCAATFLMGQARTIWQCRLLGGIQGLAGGVLSLYILPYLIKNWFYQKQGTALGIAAMLSGLLAALMNPLIQQFSARASWRQAYMWTALAAAALSLSAVLLWVVRQPADLGMLPYGLTSREVSPGKSAVPGKKHGAKDIALVVVVCAVWSSSVGCTQQLSSYSAAIELGAAAGSAATSLCMIGNVSGKLLLGVLNDKIGVMRASTLTIGAIFSSYCLLLYGAYFPSAFFIGAFLNGLSMVLLAVQTPLLVSWTFQEKNEYSTVYMRVCAINCLITSCSSAAIGRLHDIFGTYAVGFCISGGLLLFSLILLLVCRRVFDGRD